MKKKKLSIRQKNADKDLNIIVFFTLIPLIIYLVFGNNIMSFAKTSGLNIWLKFIPIILIQFGLAGLGSLTVILYRKEKLKLYGLVKNNLFKTVILSMIVCIPSLIFLLVNNEVKSYFPLKGCFFTEMFLNANFSTNLLGYLLINFKFFFFANFVDLYIYNCGSDLNFNLLGI